MEGKATRREMQEWWSIDDLADASDALDAWQEAERKAQKAARK